MEIRYSLLSAIRKHLYLYCAALLGFFLYPFCTTICAEEPTTIDRLILFSSPTVQKDDPATGLMHLEGRTIDGLPLLAPRGSVVIRLTPKEPFGGYPSYLSTFPGTPIVDVRCSASWYKVTKDAPEDKTRLDSSANIILRYAYDSNPAESLEGHTILAPGEELFMVWTWSGITHHIYLNGKLVTTYLATSPFPRDMGLPIRLLANMGNDQLTKAPLQEISIYNYTMTSEEVAVYFTQKDGKPFQAQRVHVPTISAQWGPSEKKVYIAADAGNALAGRATSYQVMALTKKDDKIATGEMIAYKGFAEMVLPLPNLLPGTYRIKAILLDAQRKPITTVESTSWEFPKTDWVGNTLGITDKLQSPWLPITVNGAVLKVWGREYNFIGGFGLPRQITSQKRDLLSKPVALEITKDGQNVPLTNLQVKVTDVKPHLAKWEGTALAGDVQIKLDGSLTYDGMVLITLQLTPKMKGQTVKLDSMKLQTTLFKDRALFLNTCADQGYWWYPYKGWVPEKPGVVFNNLQQKAGKTNYLFFVLFSDDDTALEWFADNPSGWQIDEKKPIQEIIREENGDVRLQCLLANKPFELSSPLDITFGYDATPVKPLPDDARTLYCYHHLLTGITSDLAIWWLWGHSSTDKARPNIFSLLPDDPESYAKAVRTTGIKAVPFTNQHVLVPSGDDRKRADSWNWFNNIIGAETENNGWSSVPSRGLRDYWAYNVEKWIKSGGMDGIYIDEAGTETIGSSLLSGAGYIKADGTHGFGHNTLGMRDQLKRVRQLFIDNGKRPLVWIPVYGKIIPHVYAFTDIFSEGEAFMLEKPNDPDWIDQWGANLLTPYANNAGAWLRSLGPAQKFGSMPLFLDYIKFYNDPKYLTAERAEYGLLGLFDITSVNPALGWVFKAKQDFGVAAKEVTFHRYFKQKEITTSRDDVKVSYYQKGNHVLFIITNLGKDPFDGTVTVDLKALGISLPKATVTWVDSANAEITNTEVKRTLLTLENATLKLQIPQHDFRLIQVEESTE